MTKTKYVVVLAEDLSALLTSLDHTYMKPSTVERTNRLRKALAGTEPPRYDITETGLGPTMLPRPAGRFLKFSDLHPYEAHAEAETPDA